jgi:hypothetical protein
MSGEALHIWHSSTCGKAVDAPTSGPRDCAVGHGFLEALQRDLAHPKLPSQRLVEALPDIWAPALQGQQDQGLGGAELP